MQIDQLSQLRQFTTVVADTGDIESMRQYEPTDATTNPSLILKAIQKKEYQPLLDKALQDYPTANLEDTLDRLLVNFGQEILKIVPGRVSTEVDARLSFDTSATVERAKKIIHFYKEAGIDKARVLIKIASTWEGIQAAKQLEKEGITCNMTLLFSMPQAIACANANVQLISPFVGRIYDWYKKSAGSSWKEEDHAGINDPGVQSVSRIYHYYKNFGIKTEIMGASFRNIGQIIALAGCDLLTISPDLLRVLSESSQPVSPMLIPEQPSSISTHKPLTESEFRLALNQDAMGTEKLAEGIRAFITDAEKLDAIILKHKQAAV